jgi:hypothetical protein
MWRNAATIDLLLALIALSACGGGGSTNRSQSNY